MELFSVSRDGQWISLPRIFLVKGDLIFLPSKESLDNIKYRPTDEEGFYIVQENMLGRIIEESFPPQTQKPKPPVILSTYPFPIFLFSCFTFSMVILYILNPLRVRINFGNYDWIFILLQQPVYLTWFIMNPSLGLTWHVMKWIAQVKLYSLFDSIENDKKGWFRCFWSNFFSMRTQCFDDSLLSLGCITSIFVIDRDGVLSDEFYVPQRILIPKSQSDIEHELVELQRKMRDDNDEPKSNLHSPRSQVRTPRLSREQSPRTPPPLSPRSPRPISTSPRQRRSLNDEHLRHAESVPTSPRPGEEDHHHPRFVPSMDIGHIDKCRTLDLVKDLNHVNYVTFENPDWNQFINILKPLGLNSILITKTHFNYDCVCLDNTQLWKKYIYYLAREIGFSDSVLDPFKVVQVIHTQRDLSQINTLIVSYQGKFQIHSEGEPKLVLSNCVAYFDGEKIVNLNDDIRREILEQYTNWKNRQDLFCFAMAYKPIEEHYETFLETHTNSSQILHIDDEDDQDEVSNTFKTIQQDQIFLGMIGMSKPPKEGVREWITSLSDDSGIRFIYASPKNEQTTKAFGKSLGLDTDWNSCISLTAKEVQLDESDLKAHLPNGIHKIKEHLKTTDNVPLLVSLFSDVLPESARDMIQILQQYGEVVFVVGSSTNYQNSPVYCQGNVSLIVDPNSQEIDIGDIQQNRIHATVNSFQNSGGMMNFGHFHSTQGKTFTIISALIEEGRRLVTNLVQGYHFFLISNFVLFLIQFFALITVTVPIYNGIQLLYMMIVTIPLFTLSLLWGPPEANLRTQISFKNLTTKARTLYRFTILWRCILPSLVGYFVFFFSMTAFLPTIGWSQLFAVTDSAMYVDKQFQACLIYSQNISLIVVTLFYAVHAIEAIHVRQSIFRHCKNVFLFIAITLAIFFQILFAMASISIYWRDLPIGYPNLPWYAYVITIICLAISFLIEELIKIRRRKVWALQPKRLKLEFATKLGMYS